MKCFVVTEGKLDVVLVDRVLSHVLSRDEYEVMSAGGRSAAVSLARSLLVTRPNPVALIVDADADSTEEAEARRQRILFEIGEVADLSRVLVLVIVPETEALLFANAEVARQVLGRDPNPNDLDEILKRPKELLSRRITGRQARVIDPAKLEEFLSHLDLASLSADSKLAALIDFISHSPGLARTGS